MAEKQAKSMITVNVNVRLEQTDKKELPDVMAYVFDATGQFLTSAYVPKDEEGQVKLELPSELANETVRIIFGPQLSKEQEEMPQWMATLLHRTEPQENVPSIDSLRMKGGYEKRIRLTEEHRIINTVIFPSDWWKWLRCSCVVKGRLVKRIPLPDGTSKELGVCHACVKIYEVDQIRWVIQQLPEVALPRLRDELARTLAASPTLPLPPPATVSILKDELEPLFRTTSAVQLRNALIANAETLSLHICNIDWLWGWFRKDLIKCVCTDEQGRFTATIKYPCFGDKPDLYFKAVQCIGGTLHTLYDPGVACHTHWNYVCGTEVVLETDDPAAITCIEQEPVKPPQGVALWVMPYKIGGILLSQIKSSGLTGFTDGNGAWLDVPFGGTLGFRLGYSSSIPYNVTGKPAYYRWLYNKLDRYGNDTEWREFATPVAETVIRHYIDYDLAHPEFPPTFPAYPLGPQEKNSMNLYEFKPHTPPPLAGHQREWPVDNWFSDIYSGILNSVKLPSGVKEGAGKYKIKLEVYDMSGIQLKPNIYNDLGDLVAPGTFDFIVPTSETIALINTRKSKNSEIEDGGFIFYMHIDNNKCEADIYDASVNGIPAGPCGFIDYAIGTPINNEVQLSFKAKHPNGFARFKFTVVRGSSGYVTTVCAPLNPGAFATAPLVTETDVNGFKRDASTTEYVFTKKVNETDMRNGCPKAAFGENLYVAATATNGWDRLSGLDASALPKAFALAPQTE